MVFRLSQKIARKVKAEWPLPPQELDPEPLADWSCHLFTAQRSQYIICCNTSTLFTCLLYGRGITDFNFFTKRALGAIRDGFEEEGLEQVYLDRVVPCTGEVCFAKVYSRSVTGSINEQVWVAKFLLEDDDLAPFQVSDKLNQNILSPIGQRYPRDVLRELCGAPKPKKA